MTNLEAAIKEVEELETKAGKGPFRAYKADTGGWTLSGKNLIIVSRVMDSCDAKAFAHARNVLPKFIEAVKMLREALCAAQGRAKTADNADADWVINHFPLMFEEVEKVFQK